MSLYCGSVLMVRENIEYKKIVHNDLSLVCAPDAQVN